MPAGCALKEEVGGREIATGGIECIVRRICTELGCGPLALLRVRQIARVAALSRKAVRAQIAKGHLPRHPDFPHDWRCAVWDVARYLAQ